MLFILNGAIHEVETRYRRKDGQKRRCKYFYAFIVYVMLEGILHLKSTQLVTITVKNVQGTLQSGFALCESIQIDPGQLNTRQFSPLLFNSLNCYENLFKGCIL